MRRALVVVGLSGLLVVPSGRSAFAQHIERSDTSAVLRSALEAAYPSVAKMAPPDWPKACMTWLRPARCSVVTGRLTTFIYLRTMAPYRAEVVFVSRRIVVSGEVLGTKVVDLLSDGEEWQAVVVYER